MRSFRLSGIPPLLLLLLPAILERSLGSRIWSEVTEMRKLRLLSVGVALLVAGCQHGCSDIFANVEWSCDHHAAPNLGGHWAGTLEKGELTLELIEECQRRGITSGTWVVEGKWRWGTLNGPTSSAFPYARMKHMDLTLIVGPDHPDRVRCFNIPKCTTLTLPSAWEGPAEASVLGTVDGSWAAPDDPVHALLTFDGIPIELWRR